MASIPRVTQQPFGDLVAALNNFAIFGSLAAGSPTFSSDPAAIQSLPAFRQGWGGAVVGNKSPTLEEMNALFLLAFYQLGHIFQRGAALYDAGTTYPSGGMCSSGGEIYVSQIDNNLGNPVTDPASWMEYVSSVFTPPSPTTYTLATSGSNSASRNVTLAAGTWQLALTSHCSEPDGGNFDLTASQSATLAGIGSVTTSIHLYRAGGSGFGRNNYGTGMGVAQFALTTPTTVMLSISSLTATGSGAFVPIGSSLTCEKIA
jgi:hypothetical protein